MQPAEMPHKDSRSARWSDDTLQPIEVKRSKRDSAIYASNNNSSPTSSPDTTKSKRQRVKEIGHEAKVKTKRLLSRHHAPEHVQAEDDDGEYDDPYENIQDNPAFDPSQLVSKKKWTVEATADRALGSIVAGAKAIAHPTDAAKRKAASKVAVEDRPYLSREADLEFLNAHADLDTAKSHDNPGSSNTEEVRQGKDNVEALEELRRSRKVAWTTSHHMRRLLVVPKREIDTPKKDQFRVRDERSGREKFDWQSYYSALNKHALQNFASNSMGHIDFAGQSPFDPEVMIGQLERFLIASAPWQTWFSSIRQIYRWEDPGKTKRWFALWCFIWYLDYVVSFTLAYAAFIVLQNRFRPKNVASLRESYNRTRDRGTAAFKFNELISQHGNDKWFDPAMQEIGPKVQTQLDDAASFLEILNNFYDWRAPDKTWATLFWFLCAIILGSTTSTQNSMKIIWMFCILEFFLGFWVGSHYPEYRHVVNSLRWIFWDIPDDNEWSMMYLRSKAQDTRASLIEKQVHKRHDDGVFDAMTGALDMPKETHTEVVDSDTDSDDDAASYTTADSATSILGGLDILSFRSHTHHGMRGQLIMFSDGLRYERKGKEQWRRLWIELVEIQKSETNIALGLPRMDGLVLIFTDGTEVRLDRIAGRDRAFNCIIGFSGLSYQVLSTSAKDETRERAKEMMDGSLGVRDNLGVGADQS